MKYIKVHAWEEFQQYKDNRPLQWIKNHVSILDNYKFSQLTDAEFGQLSKIWLLAAKLHNKIPNDPQWVKDRTGMTAKPNLIKFLQMQFLEIDESVEICTNPYENVPRVEKSREEKSTDRRSYGSFQNVKLSEDEYQKLKERFNTQTESLIEELSEGIASKGYKYKDHYATILAWARRKGNYGKQGSGDRHDNLFLLALQQEAGGKPAK